MTALLAFFGAGAMSPAILLRLKAMLIGAAVLALLCLSLTVWALLERSGRLSCEVESVKLASQVEILNASIERQNKGIDATVKAGEEARAATRKLIAQANRIAAGNQALIDETRGILSRPPPLRPDGKPSDCNDAWAEIEKRGAGK